MALKYIDKIGTKPKDTIEFINVHEIGSTILGSPITPANNYTINSNDVITSKNENIINAIDIDWNGATFKTLGKDTSLNPYGTINSTADLLRNVGNGIDEAYNQGTAALNRANVAYNLALNASGNKVGILEFRDNENLYHFVLPADNGVVKLSYINNTSYLPVNINFDSNNHKIDFGISKNTLLSYLKTTDLGGGGITEDQLAGLAGDHLEFENGKFNVVDYYSAGDGINIDDDHIISVDIDNTDIATKEYVDNNTIKTIGLEHPLHFSNTSTTEPEIAIKLDDTYFTTKKLSDTATVKALTLTDTIINKINSGGGQGIEYNSGAGINVNNTNHTISIDNTVALKSEIPNVSNYLTKDGDTKGPLAVINGTQVNESNATTDGNDIFISSDRKLKDNILDIRQDEVDKLFATESGNMHYFEWKENHKPSFGFIAQELMDFAPETVTKDSEYMQVNYNAALTKTCAALFKKIKELENRIQELENK